MAGLRLVVALGLAGLVGCVPGELFLEAPGDGGADEMKARDAGAETSHRDGPGKDARGDAADDVVPSSDTGSGDTGPPDAADAGACPTPPDCSNAACLAQGYACTPPAPSGWSIAAVDFSADAPCPPGYGASVVLATPPTGGPASCGCACAVGTAPSCVSGVIDFMVGDLTCSTFEAADANGGACAALSFTSKAYSQITSTPGATGGTCVGSPSKSVPPSGSGAVYLCPLAGSASTSGCSGGDVCVAAGSSQSRCIVEPGSVACPGVYTASHSVGTSVMDTRGCTGACTCGTPTATCGSKTLTFYTGSSCTGSTLAVDMNGSCDPQAVAAIQSLLYSATPTGAACGAASSTPTPSGTATLVGQESVCCLP